MSNPVPPVSPAEAHRALGLSTTAFTVCFAVWTIFSIIGLQIKEQLGLTETQYGLLVGMPILTGSLIRIVLGALTDRMGGRLLLTLNMLAAAVATVLLSFATTYGQMLVAALGVGLAGGSFAVGVAYVSRFYPAGKQGTALGIFGVGNVGAAVTKFVAPFVMLAWGWENTARIWAVALVVMAAVFYAFTKDDPVTAARQGRPASRSFVAEFAPLKDIRVWRFSLYYFFVFGGFVALALWLPRYLIGNYGFSLQVAGMLGAAYSIPGSIFRAYGGVLSDKIGARTVMYWTLSISGLAALVLSMPSGQFMPAGATTPLHVQIAPLTFIVTVFILGFCMSLGKAAVFKHIPTYYPQNVGTVGGVVGMIGGLGGFVLPIAFGWLRDVTGLWSSCFMLLFVLIAVCLVWMEISIRRANRPEMQIA